MSASVCGSSATTAGGAWAAARAAWSTSLARSTTFERRLTTVAPDDRSGGSGRRPACRRPRPGADRSAGTSRTASTWSVGEGRLGGRRGPGSRSGPSGLVEAGRRRLERGLEAGRRRLDDPDLDLAVVAAAGSTAGRTSRSRAAVVNRTRRMKPRLRPRSRISRRATSRMLRQRLIGPPPSPAVGRDRLHEQLGQLRAAR